jgi:hypothetical protein
MQSLCELARGASDSTKVRHPAGSGDVTDTPENFPSIKNGTSPTNLYVNELPEESFQAFLQKLKMKNNATSGTKLHKVINGVKVFKDYDDSRLDDDDETEPSGDKSGKCKTRDECVSVTEELVDGSHNGLNIEMQQPSLSELNQMAKDWTSARNKSVAHPQPTSTLPVTPTKKWNSSERLGFKERRGGFLQRTFGTNNRKRKLSVTSLQSSPPSKHLRSSRWSRGNLKPISRPSFCQRWRQITTNLLTKSRLRSRSVDITKPSI